MKRIHTRLSKQKRKFFYRVYGLLVEADRPIPGLVRLDSVSPSIADLAIRFCGADRWAHESPESLFYTSYIQDGQGRPALQIWRGEESGDYRIRYTDGLEFRADRTASSVTVRHPAPMRDDDVAAFLLGPVLGILLRLRGVTSLHASAVAFRGHALAFVGEEGSGKSTTAALFAQKGHRAISDDMVTLLKQGDSFRVSPGYPYLNLWPESVAMLCGPAQAGPSPAEEGEKCRWSTNPPRKAFRRHDLALGAIYLLGRRGSRRKAPLVESIRPQKSFLELVRHSYAARMLDLPMRVEEFRVLARLVERVPVRRVFATNDPADLERLYTVICDDFTRTERLFRKRSCASGNAGSRVSPLAPHRELPMRDRESPTEENLLLQQARTW